MVEFDPIQMLRPRRAIVGMSAVLLPFDDDGAVDWAGFEAHVGRTAEAGLIPAINMDTGYGDRLDDAQRAEALRLARSARGPGEMLAGAFVADRPGAAFAPDAYARAIALGPRAMPFFIWWCVVDQRIAMWTMMVSPVLAVFATMIDPIYFWNVLIWLVASRLVLSTVLYTYARTPDLSWPFILYFNQFINAGVKIYMIFHLSKQKWSNRGNQSAGEGAGWKERFALFQLFTATCAFITGLAIYSGLLPLR